MTNRELMKKYILSSVVPSFIDRGFTGQFPHYRKVGQDCIELITLQTNKCGGSFTVEVSAIFPCANDKNCAPGSIDGESVTVWDTNDRYRLKGTYDGWFYYHDLYMKRILGFGKDYLTVSEKRKEGSAAPKGYKLVQEFDEETAKCICDEVNRQMNKAYKWLERFKRSRK